MVAILLRGESKAGRYVRERVGAGPRQRHGQTPRRVGGNSIRLNRVTCTSSGFRAAWRPKNRWGYCASETFLSCGKGLSKYITVIANKLIKIKHFFCLKISEIRKFANRFFVKVYNLYRALKTIVLNRNTQFISIFQTILNKKNSFKAVNSF